MMNLTKKEYEKQRRKGHKTNEGYVYENPKNRKEIIKVIEPIEKIPEYLSMKQHTIKLLLENQDYFSKLKIAYPKEEVRVDDILRGYTASNIRGMELACALSHSSISLDNKIEYLKQIGQILREMKRIRETFPNLSNFYYNDIHERNFIVSQRGVVYGIDLDSCSIQDNIPISGMFPTFLPKIKRLEEKYKPNTRVNDYQSPIIPDENLDLYSYIIMILNFMSGKIMSVSWNPNNLYAYLNYLESKGANLEFLYILSYIFDEKEKNINPDYLLEYIKEIYSYSNIRFDETGILRKILR